MRTGSLVEEIAQLFVGKGLDRPQREARLLVADVIGQPVGQTVLASGATIPADQVARARTAAARRTAGVPLAYATGVAAFRQLTLAVDSRVLIPRPETEGLVDHVLSWQARWGRGGLAVDVCTGSGCIALSLATEGTFDRVLGIDLSLDAVTVARANQATVCPPVPLTWMRADLLEALGGATANVVVANPPYVGPDEWERLESSVRDHEPREALVALDDGMAVIERLVHQAWRVLVSGGFLAVEVDSQRADRARGLALAAGFGDPRIEDDLFGRPRYVLATKE